MFSKDLAVLKRNVRLALVALVASGSTSNAADRPALFASIDGGFACMTGEAFSGQACGRNLGVVIGEIGRPSLGPFDGWSIGARSTAINAANRTSKVLGRFDPTTVTTTNDTEVRRLVLDAALSAPLHASAFGETNRWTIGISHAATHINRVESEVARSGLGSTSQSATNETHRHGPGVRIGWTSALPLMTGLNLEFDGGAALYRTTSNSEKRLDPVLDASIAFASVGTSAPTFAVGIRGEAWFDATIPAASRTPNVRPDKSQTSTWGPFFRARLSVN